MLDFMMKHPWLPCGAVIMACLVIDALTEVLNVITLQVTLAVFFTVLPIIAYRSITRSFSHPSVTTASSRIFSILDSASPTGSVIYWRLPDRSDTNIYSHRSDSDYIHLWTTVLDASDADALRFDNEHFYFAATGDTVIRVTGHQDCHMDPDGGGREFLAPSFDPPALDDTAILVADPQQLQDILDRLGNATPITIGHIA